MLLAFCLLVICCSLFGTRQGGTIALSEAGGKRARVKRLATKRRAQQIQRNQKDQCSYAGVNCRTRHSFDVFLASREAEARAVITAATQATENELKLATSQPTNSVVTQLAVSQVFEAIGRSADIGGGLVASSCETDMQQEIARARGNGVNYEFDRWHSMKLREPAGGLPYKYKYNLSWTFQIHPCLSFYYKTGVYTTRGSYPTTAAILHHLLYHFGIGFEHCYIVVFCKVADLVRFSQPPNGPLMRLAERG